MKTTIKRFLLLFACIGSLTSALGQQELTAEQWQKDLRYLQETVHSKYAFLFKKIKKDKWDAEVEKLYEQIPAMQAHEIKVGLTRMVSLFEYGHTQIPFGTIAEEAVLALNLYHFEDGIYVEGVRQADKKALGAKVLKVADMPIEDALKAIRPVVPAENDQYFKGYGLRFLTVPAFLHAQGVIPELQGTIKLTLEKEGEVFEHSFDAIPLSELSKDYGFTVPNDQWSSARDQSQTPLYLKHLNEKFYFFEYVAETATLYVRQSSVFNDENESLEAFYKRLFDFIDNNDIEKLVYDVRLNGGGNNFNNKQFIKGIMARPEVNQRGKFFFIIGRNTFSAAQNLTNEIENYTEAIRVGEPTSENRNFYGDARKVRLPNSGINAYLSHAWWQDFAPWDKQEWTVPNIAAAMTFDDYVNNNDVVLNAALDYTETGFIMEPMEHLTKLFIAGKYDEVKSEGAKIASDPAYRYFDFEKEFAEAGNRLLNTANAKGGMYILELVAEFYPKSAGALYNLATAQEQQKQFEKAKESFKKLIALQPDSPLGNAAKQSLERLNKQ